MDPVMVGTTAGVALTGAALSGGVALAKLLDVARSGIGAVARPWLMVRDAEGQVKANKILADGAAELESSKERALPPAPELNAPQPAVVIDVDFENVPPLAKRTEQRLSYQEAKRQLNVECVVREAAEELEGLTEVSDEPVDDDWTARFFGNVQDVSNEQMRTLWAKILAGEVVKPGTFSLRTLEALKNLRPKDAAAFSALARVSTRDGAVFKTSYVETVMSTDTELELVDAGLIATGTGLGLVNTLAPQGDGKTFAATFQDLVVVAIHPTALFEPPTLEVLKFTRAGVELMGVLDADTDLDQVRAVIEALTKKGFSTNAHKITERIDDTTFKYSRTPLELAKPAG